MTAPGRVATPQKCAVMADDDLRLVAEIGFMAACAGNAAAALAIFGNLRKLSPDRPYPYIGLAMTHLGSGRADEAVRLLRDEGVGTVADEDRELTLFLGLALHAARRDEEGRRVLQRVLDDAPPQSVSRERARAALDAQRRIGLVHGPASVAAMPGGR